MKGYRPSPELVAFPGGARRPARRTGTHRVRESLRENEARYAKANSRKGLAHVAVYKAIRTGKLRRGTCEVCGSVRVEAHHDDYAQRLKVRWLCPRHHKAWHAANGEGANAHG